MQKINSRANIRFTSRAVESINKAEKNNQKFFQNLIEEQCREDAKEREKDRSFFLELAKILKD